jgi:hypothetical protein
MSGMMTVDAEKFLVGKHDARVDNNDGAVTAERHHVHAELAESAEGNDFIPTVNR